jgi:hypothetical protein
MYIKFQRSTVGKTTSNRTTNEIFIGVIIQNRLIRINGEMIMVWARTEQDLRQATELNF